MQNVKANLYECFHCKGEGTCLTGANGASCAACIKKNELKGKEFFGLICGSCGGIGKAEPLTERMNKRMAPILAIVLVVSLLALIFWAALVKSTHFSELLAFSGAIVGSIMGFYFSGKIGGS
ncbi:molecular chaperone DnaJ [Gammaproteobacteria bacterium 45_16_T64]|nr:molecular chaperone DnaJ [Gammaproteobacteria bacterium 45_16_T64]